MKNIEIIVQEKKTKGGKKFKKYLAVKNDGRLIEVGFNEDVVKPKKHCIAFVEPSDMNISNKKDSTGKVVVNRNGEPIKKLWIKAIQGFEKQEVIDAMEKEYNNRKAKELEDMFE